MKVQRYLISFILIISIALSGVTAFGAVDGWPAASSTGRDMPFRPTDGYVSMQNPPAFTWMHVPDAVSYELNVYSDENCTKVKYTKSGIEHNYYSFDCTFEAGKTYWWKVRYKVKDESVSTWSEPRRFRIDPDAYEFTVPEVSELKSRVSLEHPRVIAKADELEDFRSLKNQNINASRYYEYITKRANTHYNNYLAGAMDLTKPQKPSEDDPEALYNYNRGITGVYTKLVGYAYECGYAYLLSGDERYAEVAKAILLAISPWGFTKKNGELVYDTTDITSYANNDTIHRVITYKSAMVYDWIYHTMTQEEKETIKHMIRERGKVLSNHLIDGKSNAIRKMPYDSHGWTAFGFLGITAYAMYGEFPEAEYWFENVIPAYASILPPWSYQDGGWSQGTDYWKDSTIHGQEFMDVMARAGIINYYETAWGSQEYLWSLYAFPAGSYGAFGDDSNLRLPSTPSADSVSNSAYYTRNPVAKWILGTLGGEYANTINTFYINTDDIEPEPPKDYPLSHEFEDIGWVTMTSDLEDINRVHAYFKSSYYGSFNHSHADQNSFVIQAFGEKLAVKSGYYDSYHSVHDKTITRATFAHNSITIDGGNGQPSQTDDFTAKGDITEFVTQMSFDSATGDATPAYKGALDKYIRNFIYIRPGVFVVIDDLDAKGSNKSSFEWWLNAEDTTLTDYDNNSALIEKGQANLRADVIYPADTKVTFYDGFINPLDGQYYQPNASKDFDGWPHHDRIRFATPKVDKTKMIVTMSVYEDSNNADIPQTEYASDGSYVKLTFKDGTVCIVNLGDKSEYVYCDDITFMGEAVTYNDYSIMLTGGSYLEKDYATILYSDRSLTCALGYGQISMSLTEDANVELDTTTEYLKVSGEGAITDHKGRNADSSIGVRLDYSTLDYGYISVNADKGNYLLLTDKASVTPDGMIPEISATKTAEGKYRIVWDHKDNLIYDILVNGTIYEGVSSPYIIAPREDVETYTIALRARNKNIVSDWSDTLYISPKGRRLFSHVNYMRDGSNLSVKFFATNPGNEDTAFMTVLYGADGSLERVVPLEKSGDMYTTVISDVSQDVTVGTFLWNGANLRPEIEGAMLDSDSTDLKELSLDGEPLKSYSHKIDEYDIKLSEGSLYYPLVEAVAENNSTKVVVRHFYSQLKSTVTLTSQSGKERVITLNYILENSDLHKVTGASAETDFMSDTGRGKDEAGSYTGKVSRANVATLTYDIIPPNNGTLQSKTVPLKVYTDLERNKGGDHLGSRLASDRPPNARNHSEFTSPNKSYEGYDHIVVPNDDFFSLRNSNNGGSVRNIKIKFSLDDAAEVLVISTNPIPALKTKSGFQTDILEEKSYGTYMNSPGPEDKYYNISFNGMSESDFSGEMPVNYDLLDKIIDVNPLTGYSKYTDYTLNSPGKDEFTLGNTEYRVDRQYLFDTAYIKRFEEGGEVEMDFGSFETTPPRFMIIVRPLTPQKPIGDFTVTAPSSFEELEPTLLEGSNDNLETHRKHGLYTAGVTGRNLDIGTFYQQENTEGNTINIINSYIGIEGAYLLPIQSSIDSTNPDNNWMRAYYYGSQNVGGNTYPAMKNKINDWYEFTLNRSADIYVVTAGDKPAFLDDTWQKLNIGSTAFVPAGVSASYTNVYIKHIDVESGSPVRVSMKTPGTGKVGFQYYTVIKPTE